MSCHRAKTEKQTTKTQKPNKTYKNTQKPAGDQLISSQAFEILEEMIALYDLRDWYGKENKSEATKAQCGNIQLL